MLIWILFGKQYGLLVKNMDLRRNTGRKDRRYTFRKMQNWSGSFWRFIMKWLGKIADQLLLAEERIAGMWKTLYHLVRYFRERRNSPMKWMNLLIWIVLQKSRKYMHRRCIGWWNKFGNENFTERKSLSSWELSGFLCNSTVWDLFIVCLIKYLRSVRE